MHPEPDELEGGEIRKSQQVVVQMQSARGAQADLGLERELVTRHFLRQLAVSLKTEQSTLRTDVLL